MGKHQGEDCLDSFPKEEVSPSGFTGTLPGGREEQGGGPPAVVSWAPGPLAWGPGIPEIFPSCPSRAAPLCLALILSSGQHQRQPRSLLWVIFFPLGWICNLIVTMETQEFWYMKVGGKSSLLESLFQLLQRTCVAAADLWRNLACNGPGDRQDAGYLTSLTALH